MKVVTFNIRCDYGQDGLNEFANRKKLILRKINQEKPDIIGFQEVLPHVAKWLKENLNEYYVIGCGRGANLRDEQMSIAYHRDRINLISRGCGRFLGPELSNSKTASILHRTQTP